MQATHRFPGDTWDRFQVPVLEMDIGQTGVAYNMYVDLEFDASLAPNTIPITVSMSVPSGEVRIRNMEPELNANQENRSTGLCREVLRRNYTFSEEGSCTFEIENRSQYAKTKGIRSIAIVLEKTE
jgi:hypothetical protein